MGAVAIHRGIDTDDVEPDDRKSVAALFNISEALAAEIAFENDGDFNYRHCAFLRWRYMRNWAAKQIRASGES